MALIAPPKWGTQKVEKGGGAWLRKPTSNSSIVFVHGLFSSTNYAWRSPGAFWPDIVRDDPALAEYGIYSFDYDTGLATGNYSISDATNWLFEYLKLDGLLDLRQIVFVAHSMGGIIARKLAVSRQMVFTEQKISLGFFLVASPSLGSKYTRLFRALIRLNNLQVNQLAFSQANVWLNDLDKEFKDLKEAGRFPIFGRELIETHPVLLPRGWLPALQIVVPISAARYFGEALPIPNTNHSTIAQPKDVNGMQHRMLRQLLRENQMVDVHAEQATNNTPGLPESPATSAPEVQVRSLYGPVGSPSVAARSISDIRRVLRYREKTSIDPTCLPSLRKDTGNPIIEYHREIVEKIETLKHRRDRPQEHVRKSRAYHKAKEPRDREAIAVTFISVTETLLLRVENQQTDQEDGLYRLLKFLDQARTRSELAAKALSTYATLSALLMIRELKQGSEIVDGSRYAWFEEYGFSDDHSPILFDAVPKWSQTGKSVFGFGRWVTARVGRGDKHESAMVPLIAVVDCFENYKTGGADLFHQWILPQLFLLYGNFWGEEDFPADTYHVLKLIGAGGKEWSVASACPWPEIGRLNDWSA